MSLDFNYLEAAIGFATHNVADGGGPFGAVIVTADGFVVPGVNRVTANMDPTAHAEIVAIRSAAALVGSHDLSGATLYSSCAPCPMCLTAALWARVDKIIFAASPADAAAAGFDDATFYEQVSGGFVTVTDALVISDSRPSRLEPFEAWAQNAERTDY